MVHEESENVCSNYDFNTDECIFDELDRQITSEDIGKVIQKLKKRNNLSRDE